MRKKKSRLTGKKKRGCKQKLAMVFVEFPVGWGVFLLYRED